VFVRNYADRVWAALQRAAATHRGGEGTPPPAAAAAAAAGAYTRSQFSLALLSTLQPDSTHERVLELLKLSYNVKECKSLCRGRCQRRLRRRRRRRRRRRLPRRRRR